MILIHNGVAMAKRSKIEMLPDNVLGELNYRLQNSRFSEYQQHSDWLHEQRLPAYR